MENIIWKNVLSFEELYEVNNLGQIKRKKGDTIYKDGRIANFSETILKQSKNKKGYNIVYFSKNSIKTTKSTHRIVAEAFIPNPLNLPQVNHIDGDKNNNCVENLEWITNIDNIRHAFRIGLFKNRKSGKGKKVINTETGEIFETVTKAAKSINMYQSTLSYYLNNNIDKNLNLKYV